MKPIGNHVLNPRAADPPGTAPAEAPASEFARHPDGHVYRLLFILNILSLVMIAWASTALHREYVTASSDIGLWSDVAHRGYGLAKAAREVTAPVNDVFSSSKPRSENLRLQTSLDDLRAMLELETARLSRLEIRSQRDLLTANLQKAEKQLQLMADAARESLRQYSSGNRKEAGASMAVSDRMLREFLDTMDSRNDIVAGIQSDILIRDDQFRGALEKFLMMALMLLALLAAIVMFYGLRLSRDARAAMKSARQSARDLAASETKLLSINHELSELLDAQQRFVADAAHHLRTPVAGIKLQLERAMKADDKAEIMPPLSQAMISAKRLEHLAEQLLTLARSGAGMKQVHPLTTVDLSALAKEAALQWFPVCGEKHIDLEFRTERSPVTVLAAEPFILEMLSNILDNAVRHSPEYGRISITVLATPQPSVVIEDQGAGIPESECEKVFNRFYRTPNTPGTGSGLGLAIVREIAAFHEAEVKLEKPDTGPGLRVRITFPLPTLAKGG